MEHQMGDHATSGDNATSREKGKGKDVATTETNHEPSDDSVVSRIGKSAVGLSKSVLQSKPTASDLSHVASSEKAASGSGSKTTITGESSSVSTLPVVAGTNVFRSGQSAAHVATEEAAFSDFLGNTSIFVPSEPAGWQAIARGVDVDQDNIKQPGMSVFSVAEQEKQDGAEVVNMLLGMNEEMPRYDEDVAASETELHGLRQALFGDESARQLSATDWNNVLNFVPEFLSLNGHSSQGAGASVDSFSSLGVKDPSEAGQLWLEQWNRVLTSYTDEVWGDLGGLVREAREEVQQLEQKPKESGQPPAAKAIRRLQQILTHVRARL